MKKKERFRNVSCNLCDSDKWEFERKINGYNLVKCSRCGFVFVNPRPYSQSVLDSYRKDSDKVIKFYKDSEEEREPDNLRRIRIIKSLMDKDNPRLLDLGCGDLFFLRLARQSGFDVCGLEIRRWAVEIANNNMIKLYTQTIEESSIPKESFDVIHSDSVFEHLDSPMNVLFHCHRILAKGGLIVINVPNYDALSIKLGIDNFRWMQNCPPGHLNYFTPRTLKLFLERSGFTDIKLVSVWLGHEGLRKVMFYDKCPKIKGFIKRNILNRFKVGNDLLILARRK